MNTNQPIEAETRRPAGFAPEVARRIYNGGYLVARIGLVVTILWIGAAKFTVAEATAIEPLISGSPFMSWLLDIVSLRTLSASFGVIELVTATLLALGLVRNIFGVVGAAMATGLFVVTLSFLITSTSYEHTVPFLSPGGQFIVKDIVLLGASLMILGRSLVQHTGAPAATS